MINTPDTDSMLPPCPYASGAKGCGTTVPISDPLDFMYMRPQHSQHFELVAIWQSKEGGESVVGFQ